MQDQLAQTISEDKLIKINQSITGSVGQDFCADNMNDPALYNKQSSFENSNLLADEDNRLSCILEIVQECLEMTY